MTKNRSKMLIIFLTLILIIGLVATFVSFTYPLSIGGVKYKYTSFVSELVLGEDISEGVLLEYQATPRQEADDDNYDALMTSTIDGLKDILEDSGFKNSTVVRNGDTGIRVEVGGVVDKDDSDEVIGLIGSPKQLVFTSSQDDPEDETAIFATGDDVKSVKAKEMSNGVETVYYVEITFKKDSVDKIKTKTEELVENDEKFYVFIGGDSPIVSGSEAITTESITIGGQREDGTAVFVDRNEAEKYAVQIRTGMLALDLVCSYHGTISASLGYNSMLYIWIALGIMVVASLIFFIIRYKQIGAMAMFNMLFYIVIGLFFLQAVPLVHINLSGVLAIILGYIIAGVGLMQTLENARNEYAKGKKLHTSLHQGINASLASTLTINIMLILAGIVCALMPSMAVQSFGLVSLVLGFVNIFCSQALMRLMINLYLPFNSEDGKKCNFTREEGLKND